MRTKLKAVGQSKPLKILMFLVLLLSTSPGFAKCYTYLVVDGLDHRFVEASSQLHTELKRGACEVRVLAISGDVIDGPSPKIVSTTLLSSEGDGEFLIKKHNLAQLFPSSKRIIAPSYKSAMGIFNRDIASIQSQLKPNDEVNIIYSGHGSSDFISGMSKQSFISSMKRLPADVRKKLILDTCYSGGNLGDLNKADIPNLCGFASEGGRNLSQYNTNQSLIKSLATHIRKPTTSNRLFKAAINDEDLFPQKNTGSSSFDEYLRDWYFTDVTNAVANLNKDDDYCNCASDSPSRKILIEVRDYLAKTFKFPLNDAARERFYNNHDMEDSPRYHNMMTTKILDRFIEKASDDEAKKAVELWKCQNSSFLK